MHSDFLKHNLPKLPTKSELISQLTSLNEQFAHPNCGPEYVSLYCEGAGWPDARWTVGCDPADWPSAGREYVRGDGKFDAYMSATRLLTEARKAGYK
jgi:hypothetical protein